MLRRDFLKTSASFVLGSSQSKDYGWLPPLLSSDAPRFLDIYPQFEGVGKGTVVLLYKYLESILGSQLKAHYQTGPDCTSQASGLGVDIIQAIQALLKKDRWVNKVATEVLHIGARLTIGNRKNGGVRIDEVIRFLIEYGTIFRKKYRNYDFTTYNYNNCTKLEKNGIPPWLLKECKKCQCTALKVSNWNETRDAIRSLYPIVIGSSEGFDDAKRDKDGFAKPKGTWYHAWLLIAIDDRSKRPGGCLMSSHGDNWVQGPRRYNQPKGSIWVEKNVLEDMIIKYGDSFALCQLNGLTPTRYQLWSNYL